MKKEVAFDLVDKAFEIANEFLYDVIFKKTDESTFNFSTGQLNKTAGTEKTVKVVITNTFKKKDVKDVVFSYMLVKTQDLPDISFYDTIEVAETDWKIGDLIKKNDFITKLEIYA